MGFFAVLTYLFILANLRLVRWLGNKLRGRLLAAVATFSLVLVYLAGMVGAAYVAIVAAIYLAGYPYRLRDFFGWLFARGSRARALGAVLAGYGALLAVLAFTY